MRGDAGVQVRLEGRLGHHEVIDHQQRESMRQSNMSSLKCRAWKPEPFV